MVLHICLFVRNVDNANLSENLKRRKGFESVKKRKGFEKKKKEVKDYVKNVRKGKKGNVKNRSIEALSINTKLVQHDYLVSRGLDMPKRCKDCIARGNRPTPERRSDSNSSSGGCFITTAVCEYFGREDDCYELTMLRSFRDNWLAEQKNGKLEISLYYDCAPKLVEKMKSSNDYAATCEELMNNYIRPCVELIKRHKEEECRQLYIKGLQYMLNKYQ